MILQALDRPMSAMILEEGELVTLALRHKLYESGQLIRNVYFPLNCVVGFETKMHDGHQIEVGTIGREGMAAIPLLMSAANIVNDCYCQVPGTAVRIDVALFRDLSSDNAAFRQLLDRYLQGYVTVLGQLAACNGLHSVYERCARWLLMAHDRVAGDKIEVTHSVLAMALGIGRTAATIAATALQERGYIQSSRGSVTIRDRLGLEDAACQCYGIASEQFPGIVRSVPATKAGKAPTTRRGADPQIPKEKDLCE